MTYYDDIAEGYEELYKEEQLKKIQIMLKYGKFHEPILDVGSGTGIFIKELRDKKCIGIDPSKELIKLSELDNIQFGHAENLPYKDKSFGTIVSVTAIQNFDDLNKGLLEIKRVMKVNGIFSVLKSSKINKIKKMIYELFEVKEEIDEGKDVIFFVWLKKN